MLHVIYGRDSYSIVRELLKSMKSEGDGSKIEKWILRKAFQGTGYLPEDILWRYKVQYTQGAGCESLGEKLAESEISEDEYERIKAENPKATINSREAAYYFKIFRKYHPQDSVLGSIGIWTGFDFAEERENVQGTMDGNLKHVKPIITNPPKAGEASG
ncbi:MAG: asparagine synthase-related protein [Candidatus Contubernalis sp.]|nr:asparagine synthase-related protein [Candidatus Contubernalis sp.]